MGATCDARSSWVLHVTPGHLGCYTFTRQSIMNVSFNLYFEWVSGSTCLTNIYDLYKTDLCLMCYKSEAVIEWSLAVTFQKSSFFFYKSLDMKTDHYIFTVFQKPE